MSGDNNQSQKRVSEPKARQAERHSDVAMLCDSYALAELNARQNLIRLCSQIVDSDGARIPYLLSCENVAKSNVLAGLHSLRRRLETDAAIVGAALARVEAQYLDA